MPDLNNLTSTCGSSVGRPRPSQSETVTETESAASILRSLAELRADVGQIRETLAGRTKEYMTVEEIARQVGRAPYTIRRWLKEGRIEAVRVTGSGPRGRLLIPRGQLARLIETGRGDEAHAFAMGPTDRGCTVDYTSFPNSSSMKG